MERHWPPYTTGCCHGTWQPREDQLEQHIWVRTPRERHQIREHAPLLRSHHATQRKFQLQGQYAEILA